MARGRGAPTKLTREVQDTIVQHVRVGGYLTHAVEAAGIGFTTYQSWMERAKRYEAGEGTERDRPYHAFAIALRKAQGQDALRWQSVISRAALAGDWKAAAWSLEKKYPNTYGQRPQSGVITIRGGGGGAAAIGGGDGGEAVARVEFYLPDNGRRPDSDPALLGENTNGTTNGAHGANGGTA